MPILLYTECSQRIAAAQASWELFPIATGVAAGLVAATGVAATGIATGVATGVTAEVAHVVATSVATTDVATSITTTDVAGGDGVRSGGAAATGDETNETESEDCRTKHCWTP